MKIKEYEHGLTAPLREATILLLLREDEVLLAMKKRGFGMGKWNGAGGKPNPGEDILEAAIREAEEEIGITPKNIQEVAQLNYYHLIPVEKNWNQKVHVFIAYQWDGEIVETEEMSPQWFKISDIPYSQMWSDDALWMPKVFAGEFVTGSFMFTENGEMVEHYFG